MSKTTIHILPHNPSREAYYEFADNLLEDEEDLPEKFKIQFTVTPNREYDDKDLIWEIIWGDPLERAHENGIIKHSRIIRHKRIKGNEGEKIEFTIHFGIRQVKDTIEVLKMKILEIVTEYTEEVSVTRVSKEKNEKLGGKHILYVTNSNNFEVSILEDGLIFSGRTSVAHDAFYTTWDGEEWDLIHDSTGGTMPVMISDPKFFEKFENLFKQFIKDLVLARLINFTKKLGITSEFGVDVEEHIRENMIIW